MEKYLNRNGNSGIINYGIGVDFIDLQFQNNKIYRYSYSSTGRETVEYMKKLARFGSGLNGFVIRNKVPYEKIF